mgnify:CR=1 FL=1
MQARKLIGKSHLMQLVICFLDFLVLHGNDFPVPEFRLHAPVISDGYENRKKGYKGPVYYIAEQVFLIHPAYNKEHHHHSPIN